MSRPGIALTEGLFEPALYVAGPTQRFATLCEQAPVAWSEEKQCWVVTSHKEVSHISTHPQRFVSGQGILVDEIGTHYESPPTMMHTDPPAHTRYRRLVQPAFKPTAVTSLEAMVRTRAVALIEALPAGEPIDLVPRLTVPFPLQVIAGLLGLEADRWPEFYTWSEAAIPGAVEISEEERATLMGEMWNTLMTLAVERRADPQDDVLSALATATSDGELLSEAELAMFLIQLLVAGNETTRNMLSAGIYALGQHPAQWTALAHAPESIPIAVEELLRWTTPVISFMRTAAEDCELSGVDIAAGDPVLMVYAAANRDPRVFGESAQQFDTTRQPNNHVSFGFGTHFCLGAALARLEARVVLEELVARFPSLLVAGELTRSPSSIIAGATSSPVTLW